MVEKFSASATAIQVKAAGSREKLDSKVHCGPKQVYNLPPQEVTKRTWCKHAMEKCHEWGHGNLCFCTSALGLE